MAIGGGIPDVAPMAPLTSVLASQKADMPPPSVKVQPGGDPPTRKINSQDLMQLGQKMDFLFRQYISDRRIAELRWLRNERQYLGLYDPEIEKELNVNRSKAYPRITRVKCVSVLSRLMNLMFPGNERNWEVKASPSPDLDPKEAKTALNEQMQKDKEAGIQPSLSSEYLMNAMQSFADRRAEDLCTLLDDQLEELGGNQTLDYVQLNRKVLAQGILYGIGLLCGPYARAVKTTKWTIDASGMPKVQQKTIYKPMYETLKIWDFYPDLSAKTLEQMDGYFVRKVMSRAQVRALAEREDFFGELIKKYLATHQMGNYRPQPFELELRAMGVRVNVNEMKTETSKYEVIIWHGKLSGAMLQLAGVDVAKDKLGDDLDAELWMIDANVIKADLNPWAQLGVSVRTLHTFLFDEDDTSPVGHGLPNVIRDSQMACSAATRMLLDNASVVCGPNLELNTDLLRADQDLTSTAAYKIWYREGTGVEAQWPAVRNVQIDSHLEELLKIIELFMDFADKETFVGPATGGDMEKLNSEPMRTAAGASMLRGDAALPFKDIVRNFDAFTQSVIEATIQFNKKFNPDITPKGDYNVIARGATSLIAKEVRGLQIDQLVTTLTPEEKIHVDMRKLVKARFAVRDMLDLLVTEEEAERRQRQFDASQQQQRQSQQQLIEAEIRKTIADAFKNIAQGQKNSAAADANSVNTALTLLEHGMQQVGMTDNGGSQQNSATGGGTSQPSSEPGPSTSSPGLGMPSGAGQGTPGGMPAGGGTALAG